MFILLKAAAQINLPREREQFPYWGGGGGVVGQGGETICQTETSLHFLPLPAPGEFAP